MANYNYALRGWLLVVMKLLCKGGWVGWGNSSTIFGDRVSLLVGATVGISFLLRLLNRTNRNLNLP